VWGALRPLLPARTQAKVTIVQAGAAQTADAIRGRVDLTEVPNFIEGGLKDIAGACPTKPVPAGIIGLLAGAAAGAPEAAPAAAAAAAKNVDGEPEPEPEPESQAAPAQQRKVRSV
jgi:hypothetical protein